MRGEVSQACLIAARDVAWLLTKLTACDPLVGMVLDVQGGIVMVDDYFAEGWPGVSEGVHAFMLKQRPTSRERGTATVPTIVPFFVGFNKVLFAADELSGTYQDALMSGQNIIGSDLLPPVVYQ